MFDKFGNFESAAELNAAAAGMKTEGDFTGLIALAKENGIPEDDAKDYYEGYANELATPVMAALGKLQIEADAVKKYEIIDDWITYIRSQIIDSEEMAAVVRKTDKTLSGCIAELLKWAYKNMYAIDREILKAAGVSGTVKLGIPGQATAKKIIKKYYLGK